MLELYEFCKWETDAPPRQTIGSRVYVRSDTSSDFAEIESVKLEKMSITKRFETTEIVGPDADMSVQGLHIFHFIFFFVVLGFLLFSKLSFVCTNLVSSTTLKIEN